MQAGGARVTWDGVTRCELSGRACALDVSAEWRATACELSFVFTT